MSGGYDKDKAKKLYQMGQLSNDEIAKIIGCKKPTLYGWIRKFGWTRDLTYDVASAARTSLSRDYAGDDAEDEQAMIAAAAEASANVVREHKVMIQDGREIIRNLFAEIAEVGTAPKEIEDALFKGLAGNEDIDVGKVLAAYSSGSRAKSLNMLATALTKLIDAERKTWNLDEERSEKPFERLLRELDEMEDADVLGDDPNDD